MTQLLSIREPDDDVITEQEQKTVIGIDLGTTHSLVSVIQNDKVQFIEDEGSPIIPSVVAFDDDGTPLVGQKAVDSPYDKIASIKRYMGRGIEDVQSIVGNQFVDAKENSEGILHFTVGQGDYSAVAISAAILNHLKTLAEEALQSEVKDAVVTVPAYFDEGQRQATKDAATLAGLNILRLVSEPTAAALAYGLDSKAEGIYAVYDLGGGTFDFSLLKLTQGVFQVLATGGNTTLGGDDFDQQIVESILWQYTNEQGQPAKLSPKAMQDLQCFAKSIKEHLSTHNIFEGQYQLGGVTLQIAFDQAQFNAMIEPAIYASMAICDQVLRDANHTAQDINEVILVGGSTRIPYIQQQVEAWTGRPPITNVDPDKVVAEGAALQASGLSGAHSNLLLDVTPLSLGLETMGGLVEKIIPRNTPIPVQKTQSFTTHEDGQSGMIFHILQGEREAVKHNRSLATFELKGIPPMKAGDAKVEVTFTLDVDGLLTVKATEIVTQTTQTLEVKPSYGLSEQMVMDLLKASIVNAKEDVSERLLIEVTMMAQKVITQYQDRSKDDRQISKLLTDLESAIKCGDRTQILSRLTNLENYITA